jgi:hypothetical protein
MPSVIEQCTSALQRGHFTEVIALADEALFHLQRYTEARQQYLEPAVRLVEVAPYTRVGLWHVLGRCYLAEHASADLLRAVNRTQEFLQWQQRYLRS